MYTTVASERCSVDKDYGDLLQSVQPRKIETEQDYLQFSTVLEGLLEKEEEEEELSEQESLLVELLMLIVQEYEAKVTKLSTSEPRDVLIHLMESNNLKQAKLVGVIGSSGVVSEVINGKREISKSQARKLGELFHVSYKIFL